MHGNLADVNAIVYLRISDDRAGDEAGVDRQREDCERRCRDRDWTIVAVESDNDVSAAGKRKRPGFEAMLTRIASGDVQVVVAWALDRIQRNRRDEVRLYELCQERGVTVSLVRGPDLEWQTPTGRYLADNLGSLARLEIEQKSDRQVRTNEQKAKAGKWVGGRRPFGYEPDGVTVREAEAQAVREAYEAVVAGVPLGEIARKWNAAGHTTGQAGWKGDRKGVPSPWRHDSVRAVLLNARYCGHRAHRGEVVGAAEWPALVDEYRWRAAVDILRHPGRRKAPKAARALLTGLALCGVCGATVHAGGGAVLPNPDEGPRRTRRGYRCSAAFGHLGRAAEPVEQFVSDVVVARLQRPDARDLLTDTTRPDVDALREEAVTLRSRLDWLALDFADGTLTGSQLRAATGRLREQLAAVEAEMADAGRVDALGPLVLAEDVTATWEALTVSRRRVVIDVLMVVTLHPPGRGVRTFRPETVGIEWRTA